MARRPVALVTGGAKRIGRAIVEDLPMGLTLRFTFMVHGKMHKIRRLSHLLAVLVSICLTPTFASKMPGVHCLRMY
jgi:hypothetical protein